jgi:kynurenine formamidase
MRNKKKWDIIGPEDFEKATPKIEKGDWVIINTGWHHKWDDHYVYINHYPGLYKEGGEWLVKKGIKGFGITGGALDSPLAHAPLSKIMPWLDAEYKRETGEDPEKKWPIYEPAHYLLLGNLIPGIENIGGDVDQVTGKRVTIAAFPLRWIHGDGSMIRVVAIEGLDL